MEDSASCSEVANKTQPPQFRRGYPTGPRANACDGSARAAPHVERNRVSGSPRADARRRSPGRRHQRTFQPQSARPDAFAGRVLVVAPSDVARALDSRPGLGKRAQSPLAALEPAPQESESFRSQRIAAKPAAAVWARAWASMLVSALAHVAPEWTARWPPDCKWRAPPRRQLALSTLAMLPPTLALAPALVATAS